MTPKIIELVIQDNDQEAGLDGIALVENPAHEAKFEYFSEEEKLEPSHYVLNDEEIPKAIQMFASFGEPQGLLESEGWKIVKVEKVGREHFQIESEPNKRSYEDSQNVRVRYKYVGPKDDLNRQFCADMMNLRRVYRIEDIDLMTRNQANSEFGFYDIFRWRGSYNCRHGWVKLLYVPQGLIYNNDKVKKGLEGEQLLIQDDTRTTATIEAGNTPPRIGDEFKRIELGLEDACWEGYEPIGTKEKDGRIVPNCVPIKEMKEQFESYDDYPESVKNNACKVLEWREKYGDEVQGMTQVGWTRANQLCKGEKISEETIARMSAFQRHRKNAEVAPELKDTPWKDAGHVAWLGWGGTTGVNWAESKLQSIEKMSIDVSGLSPYVSPTGKTEMSFSVVDEDKRMLVGPAMIPNKLIIRRNEITGDIYYVFFTSETILKLQQKFMMDKLLDATNVEHSNRFLNNVDVVESWIVDDPIRDKQQVFGMDYPAGTWMISVKVNDDKIWNAVKEGKLKGFSVQGYFAEKTKFNNTAILDEIKNILKQVR